MKTVIIGNGVAGITAARTLRDKDKNVEIAIYAAEPYHYYPRPKLIDLLAGKATPEQIISYPAKWYEEKGIQVHLSSPVDSISPVRKKISVNGKEIPYERLLLASGASAFLPPFENCNLACVFTLRTLDDALKILNVVDKTEVVTIIGGGTLGIEIAAALSSRGLKPVILERAEHLLIKQLDAEAGQMLQSFLRERGIEVRTKVETTGFEGDQEIKTVRLKSGEKIGCQQAIISAGIRPNLSLLASTGIHTDKGIIVDEHLSTSVPDIYAAGDVAEFQGQLYGIIPAAIDQGTIAAYNLLSPDSATYKGTVWQNILKVAGIDVTSLGIVHPPDRSYQEIKVNAPGLYKKFVVRNNHLVGAIVIGSKKGVFQIAEIIKKGINISGYEKALTAPEFDFKEIISTTEK